MAVTERQPDVDARREIGLRSWVTAAAVFAIALLLWIVAGAALTPLLLLFTAILVAAGLRPVVNALRKRMAFSAAVACTFGALIVLVAVVGLVLIQPVIVELAKLVVAAPGYAHELGDRFTATQRLVQSDPTAKRLADMMAGGAGGVLTGVGQWILGGPAFVAAAFSDALLILLLSVGWMISAGDLERFVLSLIPAGRRENWAGAFADIEARLSAYVKGVVINGSAVGIATGGAFALFGIPYGLILGFVTAIFQAIPMVGSVISLIAVVLIVLATGGWTKMWIALAIFCVIQAIDQNVVSPAIFGKGLQLSFLLIIFSTIVGGTMLGIAGAFLAVPMAAVLQVLVVRIVAPALRGPQSPV